MESSELECMENLSELNKRDEMIKSLEEEFKRGVAEIAGHPQSIAQGGPEDSPSRTMKSRVEHLREKIHVRRRGEDRWEGARSRILGNRVIFDHRRRMLVSRAEDASEGIKIHVKDNVLYFNILDNCLLIVTERGKIKIFAVGSNFHLEGKWETYNNLFIFLMRSGQLEEGVLDSLSRLMILLFLRRIADIEGIFQAFLVFIQALTVKKILFVNGFVVVKDHLGDLQVFDESLRHIPLGINKARVMSSIAAEASPSPGARFNRAVGSSPVTLRLQDMRVRVSKTSVKITYNHKQLYEVIRFPGIEQFVCVDRLLFLKRKDVINVVFLK